MSRPSLAIFVLLVVADTGRSSGPTVAHGLRVPAGFTVTEFAGDDLAHDCYTLTINPKGQVVIAGRGYIRLLVEGGDGKAVRAVEVADHPKDGAMGLLWEGDTLWAVGDGGLRRFKIGPDGKAVGPSELVKSLKTGSDHDAHALRRGPDGWLYWLCGNHAGLTAKHAERPTSPVRDPIAGGIVRYPPDMSYSEIVADGFRNPYGFDFNGDGELITYDSDNERCVGMPWYEGTRLYHVVPGGHYGWQSPQHAETWRMPPYFPDVVAPLADLGRGSPTGVVCYRHKQFPEKYRGGVFLGEWTFGRVYYAALTQADSSYTAKVETFLQAVGDEGFAPTGLAVHPRTGDLYVSIGGRGTRGAVYRIRYEAGIRDAAVDAVPPLPPRLLEWRDDLKATLPKLAVGGHAAERRRALELLWRHREHFDDRDRRDVLRGNLPPSDRGLLAATARLLALQQEPFGDVGRTPLVHNVAFMMGAISGPFAADSSAIYWAIGPFTSETRAMPATVDHARCVQLVLGGIGAHAAIGTVWEGYTPRVSVPAELRTIVLNTLRGRFPSVDPDRDREVGRMFAMLVDDNRQTLANVADRLTADSHPLDDIHYLICLARLTAPRTEEVTSAVKNALLDLERKLTARGINRDRNWPLRIAELHAELAKKDPALNEWLVTDPDFARPGNVLFTRCPGFDRARAARRFYDRATNSSGFPWSPELVALMGELPAELSGPLLAKLWDRGGLEDAILPLLAKHPQPGDRNKFIAGLRSPQVVQIKLCLDALDKLAAPADSDELLALVRTLRALGDTKGEGPTGERVAKRLRKVAGQSIAADKAAWTAWLTKTYPDLAAKLGGTDGVDVAAWQKRLAAIDWSGGDAVRGKSAFAKASCVSCHSGAQAVGPDLRGVAGRFGRDDLMTAIIQPSKDISPRYRTVLINTNDGKSYQGLVIYEAIDGLILQTGPATTVRIGGPQIESRGFTDASMMPAGLLDKLTDGEIADLLSYLRGLK